MPESCFVEVALPIPIKHTFTYRVPEDKVGLIETGSRVVVPFGKRMLNGFVVAIGQNGDGQKALSPDAIRDIAEVPDPEPLINEEILSLTKWVADYYAASWGEVLKASLPAGINTSVEDSFVITGQGRIALDKANRPKALKWLLLGHLIDAGETSRRQIESLFGKKGTARILRELLNDGFIEISHRSLSQAVKPKRRKAVRLITEKQKIIDESRLSETQQNILEILSQAGGEILFSELLEKANTGASPVTTLARKGIVEIYIQEVRRDPLMGAELPPKPDLTLTPHQSEALSEIISAIESSGYAAFLLHGVTGSGKTEVYIRAMSHALQKGLSSLMLVPEIALTPIFSRRLKAVFGNAVAILHSSLSPGERYDEWRRIRSGTARIAIGTRSAVFAPLNKLGLVIVDEEHDTSYRQNESPFYSGRDVAVMRANRVGAVVVLGSATPSLETFHNSRTKKYKYLRLPSRIGERPMAKAELIDMREVFKKAGKDVVLSPRLADAINETHRKGEQSIILLNRRGFSSSVMCRTCGQTLRCKNCDITLTYHRKDDRIVCHYCNYTVSTPKKCPFCESEYLYFLGHGTEQVEDILSKKFGQLKIARVDRDSAKRKGELTKILLAFDRGEIDMLVGTQILAKGHDFHNVTLVGVISVDIGIGLPDFRSAERTFQLLTQVAGRAGRGSLPGRVLIQTYYPEHYALKHAADQDFDGFYNSEIYFRERLGYPPFRVLGSLLFKHRDEAYAMRSAKILRKVMENIDVSRQCRILGPAQASISRLKKESRIQIIIKAESRKALRELIDEGLEKAETQGCDRKIVQIEIDPVDLL